jgi:hypothetical protein
MFQIDLTPSGELLLYLPSGRTLEITASPGGLEYIKKIMLDNRRGLRDQLGYIGTLPTQHAVDKHFANEFLKTKAANAAKEKAAEVKTKAAKLDINWDKLEINL